MAMLAATKAQFLDQYVQNVSKGVAGLKEGAARLVTQHHKARERMQTFATKVKDVAAVETVPTLKAALTTVGTVVSSLEDEHRKRMSAKLEKEFKLKADALQVALDKQKALVIFRNKAFSERVDKEKYLRKQNDKPAPKPAKVRKAEDDAATATHTLVKAEADLNASITAFQQERTATAKKMFEEMIAAELYFHARAIESLTAAYASLGAIDPALAADDMKRTLATYDIPQQQQQPLRGPPGTPRSAGAPPGAVAGASVGGGAGGLAMSQSVNSQASGLGASGMQQPPMGLGASQSVNLGASQSINAAPAPGGYVPPGAPVGYQQPQPYSQQPYGQQPYAQPYGALAPAASGPVPPSGQPGMQPTPPGAGVGAGAGAGLQPGAPAPVYGKF